jgi:hypothetical protein
MSVLVGKLTDEEISYSRLRKDVLRLMRVRFYLLAKVSDIGTKIFRLILVFKSPHPGE